MSTSPELPALPAYDACGGSYSYEAMLAYGAACAAAEREACAQRCDELAEHNLEFTSAKQIATYLAAAIRERGKP